MLHETSFDAARIRDEVAAQLHGVRGASFPLLRSPFQFLAQRYRSYHTQSCAKEDGSYSKAHNAAQQCAGYCSIPQPPIPSMD